MFSWNKTETEPDSAGPQTSERPDWLKTDAENPGGDDGKDWDTSEKVVTTDPTMDLSPTSSAGSTREKQTGSWCKRLTIVGISAILLGAFIYSAVVQKNDKDKIEWYIYYSISAAIPVFFLCHYMLCFPVKIIYTFTAGMVIWSLVMIILISLKVADTPKDGAEGDDGQTLREQYVWELSGVSVGLFSALYHGCASRCFVSKKDEA